MTHGQVETTVLMDNNRHLPLSMLKERVAAYDASGVVDEVMITDQLTSWFPLDMWTPENSGLAAIVPDVDSFPDPFVAAALTLSATQNIGISLATDAVRRGPAELMQSMTTLANLAGDRSLTLQLGAGERKQTRPFGHKRTEGLKRFEDQLRFIDAFYNSDGPITLEGNHWNFQDAWIGGAKFKRPRVFGLGGGPKLFDLTTTYADGFATSIPSTWPTAEQAAEKIAEIRKTVEEKGRDPEKFKIGVWAEYLLHDEGDEHLIEVALNNQLVQWMGIIFGRFPLGAWENEGLPVPLGDPAWHYSIKYEPVQWTAAQVKEALDPLPRALFEKCFYIGTPKQVAAQMQPYIDAGVNWIMPTDLMSFILPLEQLEGAARRSIELCGLLKQGV
ncbi:LLM class flavin-dependent oxidoreductase [Mycobacterium sp.]|uniref:LLM class flavin-dependent oxidoreductase n=1 Tax=Mycobacterium sp. TaxID=1785 RepID=UPI003BAFD05A